MSVDVFGLTFHSQQPPTASLKSANNYIARNAFDYLELNLGLDELVHLKDYHLSLHSTTPLKRVVIDDAYFRDKRRDGVVFPSSRTLAAGLSVSAAATTITTPVVSPAVNTPPRLPPALVPPPPQAAASASVPKINSVASASIKGKAPLVFSSDDEDAGNGRTKGSITGNIGPGSQSSEEDDDDIPLFRGKIHASSFRLPE